MDDQNKQQLLDFRMEYEQLSIYVRFLANMMWVGISSFFAMNTLFATALAFSYSKGLLNLDSNFIRIAHIFIPIIGAFIAVVAMITARSIVDSFKFVISRGKELEEILFAKTFTKFDKDSHLSAVSTVIGATLFLLLWVGVLIGGLGGFSDILGQQR